MCGIMGCSGSPRAVDMVQEGLRRLEYRGYDSAGISFQSPQGELFYHRRTGKLKNLLELLARIPFQANIAIGHTRWATHGKVTNANSHPHRSGRISSIHNGIIENFKELKEVLQREGRVFKSETDSEVFTVLVAKNRDEFPGEGLGSAVARAFCQTEGSSAFVVMEEGSGEIVAVKRGTPIVCGGGPAEEGLFVSSDPYALVGYVPEVFFPEDNVVCVLNPEGESGKKISFRELDGSVSQRVSTQKHKEPWGVARKEPYDHYMLKEIHEQPELIRSFGDFYCEEGLGVLSFLDKGLSPSHLTICACGTAWHAGLCIKNIIEKVNRIPVSVNLASEFRYSNPVISPGGVALFISQSGETADTLAAQKLCKQRGIKTISIVNVEGSTLFRESDENLLIKAGREVGVASTKAFTLMVLTGYILSQKLKGCDLKTLKGGLYGLADRMDEVLQAKGHIQKIAGDVYEKKGFLYMGRGPYFPIALEGALKLKEIAYVHAEGYAAGELKHGPIALVDEEIVNIALLGEELYEKTLSNIQEVVARKGLIIAVAPEETKGKSKELLEIAQYYLQFQYPQLKDLSPLLVNIVMQLFAYYVAKNKGTDIDQPRNLAKSVTVE